MGDRDDGALPMRWKSEEGSSLITLAFVLFLLLGVAAVAIDLSAAWNERRQDQTAADLAALAGALSYGDDDAVADEVMATARLNLDIEYSDDAWVALWTSCTDGDRPVDFEPVDHATHGKLDCISIARSYVSTEPALVRVRLPNQVVETSFGRALGFDSVATNAVAVASTSNGGGGHALFAGGNCGQNTLDWSGSSNTVDGGIHSNDGIDISGSNNKVEGATTWVSGMSILGSGNTFNPPAFTTSSQPWPLVFYADDFSPEDSAGLGLVGPATSRPAGYVAGLVEDSVGAPFYHYVDGILDSGVLLTNGWLTGTVLDPGVYVATDNIDLSISGISVDTLSGFTGVTFVTTPSVEGKGIVTMSGSDQTLTPFYRDLLIFSDAWKGSTGYPYVPPTFDDPDCFDPSIKLSGSGQDWKGIMFAPRGMVEISGSVNVSIAGRIVAYTIKLDGSNQDITFDVLGGVSDPQVSLFQ